jgi:hypothetical protein
LSLLSHPPDTTKLLLVMAPQKNHQNGKEPTPKKKVTSYPLIGTPARKKPEKNQEKVTAIKKG